MRAPAERSCTPKSPRTGDSGTAPVAGAAEGNCPLRTGVLKARGLVSMSAADGGGGSTGLGDVVDSSGCRGVRRNLSASIRRFFGAPGSTGGRARTGGGGGSAAATPAGVTAAGLVLGVGSRRLGGSGGAGGGGARPAVLSRLLTANCPFERVAVVLPLLSVAGLSVAGLRVAEFSALSLLSVAAFSALSLLSVAGFSVAEFSALSLESVTDLSLLMVAALTAISLLSVADFSSSFFANVATAL